MDRLVFKEIGLFISSHVISEGAFISEELFSGDLTGHQFGDLVVSLKDILIVELRESQGIFKCIFNLLAKPSVYADIEETCGEDKKQRRHNGNEEECRREPLLQS